MAASKWRALSLSAPLYEKRWRWKLICCLHSPAFWCVKSARLCPAPPPSLKPSICEKSFEHDDNLLVRTLTRLMGNIIVRMWYRFSHLLNQILACLIEVCLKIILVLHVCLSGACGDSPKCLANGGPFGFSLLFFPMYLHDGVYF